MNNLMILNDVSNKYIYAENKFLEDLINFESEYPLPVGINIKEVNYGMLSKGIVQVEMIYRCKSLWDVEFHTPFCDMLNLKLIRIHDNTVYHSKGIRRFFIYDYTYESNDNFKFISPNVLKE